MEANDERWNSFVEAYGNLQKRYFRLEKFIEETLEQLQDDSYYQEEFERITNGEG